MASRGARRKGGSDFCLRTVHCELPLVGHPIRVLRNASLNARNGAKPNDRFRTLPGNFRTSAGIIDLLSLSPVSSSFWIITPTIAKFSIVRSKRTACCYVVRNKAVRNKAIRAISYSSKFVFKTSHSSDFAISNLFQVEIRSIVSRVIIGYLTRVRAKNISHV